MTERPGFKDRNKKSEEEEKEEVRLVTKEVSGEDGGGPQVGKVGGETRCPESSISTELEDFRKHWQNEIQNQSIANKIQSLAVAATGRDQKTPRNKLKVESRLEAISQKKPGCHCQSKRLSENNDDEYPDDDGNGDSDHGIDGTDDDESEVGDDDDSSEKTLRVTVGDLICKPEVCQEATHVSALPLEVLSLIFKWVVSSYVDVDSLERLSMVCKSFYFLARDEDLWKTICMRTWEKSSLLSGYTTFREMFIEKPHVKFNGCYISKSTYFRQGEKSFDGLYRPFHVVDYYRYIRFYPEGKVFMLTSPEQPKTVVAHLRNKSNYVQGLQYGYYKLTNDRVNMVLKKIVEPPSKYKRSSANPNYYGEHEQSFYLEMSLKTVGHRKNFQLSWVAYSVQNVNKTTGESTTMTFDLSVNKYPPLYFSPVRSFAAQSELPL